ncbi:MAG: ATP synthase F1 subunit epsilon [Bacteroidales bacterium]
MRLEIITPDANVFEGVVELVQLPGIDGSFEIMNRHAAMISVLKAGKIRAVDAEKKELLFDIQGGVVEVLQDRVLILAD